MLRKLMLFQVGGPTRSCLDSENCTFFSAKGDVVGFGLCVKGECECSFEYGWTGEECTDVSAHLRILQVFGLLLPFSLFVLLMWGLQTMLMVIFFKPDDSAFTSTHNSGDKQEKLKNNLLIILGLTLPGVLLVMIGFLNRIISAFDPSYFERDTGLGFESFLSDDGIRLLPLNDAFLIVLSTVGYNLIYYGSFWLISTMIAVLKGIMLFSKDRNSLRILVRCTYFINIWLVFSAMFVFTMLIIGNIVLLSSILFFNDIILFVLVTAGRIYFGRVFTEFGTKKDAIERVVIVARQQIIGYVANVLLGVLFGIVLFSGDISPGSVGISLLMVITVAVAFVTAWLAFSNTYYCRNAINGAKLRSELKNRRAVSSFAPESEIRQS